MFSLLSITFSLLVALILSWFGFHNIVIEGMYELFGISITKTGYYFIFVLFGMAKSISTSFGARGRFINSKFRDDMKLAKDVRDAKKRRSGFYND